MCCSNAWSSAGAGATSLHQTAGCMLAADIICCCLQAAGPRERPQQIMKQCSTHACPVCFAVPQWHVFVCNIFLKPVATHASPQSSWTRSTIVRPVAAPVGPTGSASGRTGPTKTLQSGTPSITSDHRCIGVCVSGITLIRLPCPQHLFCSRCPRASEWPGARAGHLRCLGERRRGATDCPEHLSQRPLRGAPRAYCRPRSFVRACSVKLLCTQGVLLLGRPLSSLRR